MVTIVVLALVFMTGVCVGGHGEYRHGVRDSRSYGSQYDQSFDAHFQRMHGGISSFGYPNTINTRVQATKGVTSVQVVPMMGLEPVAE